MPFEQKPAVRWIRRVWRNIREWCGDAAYERYLGSREAKRQNTRTLTRAEFYAEQADRRYSQPNRCC